MSNFLNYLSENNLEFAEGARGLNNLEQVLNDIGYKNTGLHQGSAVEEFLKDNPGAIQALYGFVEVFFSDEFEEYKEKDDDVQRCYDYVIYPKESLDKDLE